MALALYQVLGSEIAEAVDAFLEPWYFRSPVWGGIARECRRAFCDRVEWWSHGGSMYGRTPSAHAIIKSGVFWKACHELTRWSWLFEKIFCDEPWFDNHESSSECSESSSYPESSSGTSDEWWHYPSPPSPPSYPM